MPGLASFSTSCLLPSPQLTKRKNKNVMVRERPITQKPLELDAIGPQAYWNRTNIPRDYGGSRSFSSQWNVIHICYNELHVPLEESLVSPRPPPLAIDSKTPTPCLTFSSEPKSESPEKLGSSIKPELSVNSTLMSSASVSKTNHRTHTLGTLLANNLSSDDPIRKRIENGANGGIQVMQYKFMRHARMTKEAFKNAIDDIQNGKFYIKNSKDEDIKVCIVSRAGSASIDENLPLNSPQRLITPDTISSSSFFRLFDVSKVGPWKIIGEIGSGSTSRVKLAIHELTGVKAAIKVIPREVRESLLTPEIIAAQMALDRAFEEEMYGSARPRSARGKPALEPRDVRDSRIHREISMLKILTNSKHPSILKLKEAFWGERLVLVILDYVPGGSLLTRLTTKGKLSEEDARPIFRSLLSGVAFLHSAGIVHRDLKIENILLHSTEKQAYLIDFGLANFFYSMILDNTHQMKHRSPLLPQDNNINVTNSQIQNSSMIKSELSSPNVIGSSFHLLDTFCGSLYYAAPELLAGHAYSGPAVDIWSLGVILFAMIAGKVPFDVPGDHVATLHSQIVRGRPSSTLPQKSSPLLVNLIAKMLTVDPRKRVSAIELLMEDPWVLGSNSISRLPATVASKTTTVPSKLGSNAISVFSNTEDNPTIGTLPNVHANSQSFDDELVCIGIACMPHQLVQPQCGPKIPVVLSPCCRGRRVTLDDAERSNKKTFELGPKDQHDSSINDKCQHDYATVRHPEIEKICTISESAPNSKANHDSNITNSIVNKDIRTLNNSQFIPEKHSTDIAHISSEYHHSVSCCPCCLVGFNSRFKVLTQELWSKLNNLIVKRSRSSSSISFSTSESTASVESTSKNSLVNIAISGLEGLLAYQYPQPILFALIEAFFLDSKKVSACSQICPWPLASMFILQILKYGSDGILENAEIDEKKLWSIFYGLSPPKTPLRLMEDCRSEIFTELAPTLSSGEDYDAFHKTCTTSSLSSSKFSTPSIRTIYLKGLLRVEFLGDSSNKTVNEMLARLVMTLGHLPGVIGGVVPISITRLTQEEAIKMRRISLFHPTNCKYIITLQLPPDDRWKEAQELSIRSVSGASLQIFPMMSMSVELVRIFWTQSFGLIFEHLSGSLETFYRIKMLVHRMIERGEAPKRAPLLEEEEIAY